MNRRVKHRIKALLKKLNTYQTNMDPSAIVVKSLNHEKSYCCKKSTTCPNASILKTVGLLSDPEVRLGDDATQRCV